MKDKDILILSQLRNNARISLTKLSRKTSIPISTIFDRLRSFEDNLICKHTTLLDFTKLGFSARANMLLSFDKDQRDEAREFLRNNQKINSVYKVTNGYDFMVEGVFKNIQEMEEFFDNLDNKFTVKSKQVFYIIDDIKRESFMADPNLVFA